ncbi:hypothetical protein TNCV_3321561 [Trichonephila clavipes]|nr:hypothetical protein TNCV_3321561 [Trichonephila clavipes]
MSPESRIGVVYKITNVCPNSSAIFAAACTLSSETVVAVTLDAASQTGASSMHQHGCICFRWHRGERTLSACIRHHHTGPSPGVMCVAPFIRALPHPTFQQDNVRPHVAAIVQTFLDTENIRLLPWSAGSPYLPPIENV